MDAFTPSVALHGLSRRIRRTAIWLPLLLIIASLACALPFSATPTPLPMPLPTATVTTRPSPTATPQPLPPDLVESDPPVNGELPLNGPITLYFNQPMDRASVEAGLAVQMGGDLSFSWIDDATVIVYLSQPLKPEMQVSLNLGDALRSRAGKPLLQPIRLDYQAAGYLELIERIPAPGASEVDPSAALIASFNRPIIPLGADPASLPAGFTLQPTAPGRGEWLNTSTYIFYPQPGLAGGQTYTIQPNPDLKSTDGGPLQGADAWSFTTARPRITAIEPSTETGWPLDPDIRITFNQPMNPDSLAAGFRLVGPDGAAVPGQYAWNDSNTILAFKPQGLLSRSTTYTLQFSGQAVSAGGTPLEQAGNPQVMTVPALAVGNIDPAPGQEVDPRTALTFYFLAPLQDKDVKDLVRVEPAVPDLSPWISGENNALYLSGSYAARTTYTVHISPDLADKWGGTLGQEYIYTFTTGALQPNLSLPLASNAIFLTTQDTGVSVQATNLPEVPLAIGRVPLNDFFALNGPNGYELSNTYQPADMVRWIQPLNLSTDQTQTAQVYLSQSQTSLAPGIYQLKFDFTQSGGAAASIYGGTYYVVVSDVQVTLKASPSQALVWAIDLRSDTPLANAPVTLYDETGTVLVQGQTDAQGIYQGSFPARKDSYANLYAVIGQPGEAQFSLAITGWNAGISPYEFNLRSQMQPSGPSVYLYSDRPMYRPGQTVYYRAVVRQADNGRYSPVDPAAVAGGLPLQVYGSEGARLADLQLTLTAFGTAHGEYALPDDAQPGTYSINSPLDPNSYLTFQVADYRKPDINLQVTFDRPASVAGETLAATVDARYFFNAPAGRLKAHWALYSMPDYFRLPDYQVGMVDTSWMDAYIIPEHIGQLGPLVKEEDAQLDANGKLSIQIPTQPGNEQTRYTLEVTVTDESGLPVSARATAATHPDSFYIGIRPDSWSSRAEEVAGFEVQVVDWEGQPGGGQDLHAEFRKVVWNREDRENLSPYSVPTFTPEYTPIGDADFVPGTDGKARLGFTPPEPGTYQLDIYGRASGPDRGAHTQTLVWVGGPGQAIWPNLPNARLHLTANQDAFQPGDTAQVFIPNTFGTPVQALLAVERGQVMSYQVTTIPVEGYSFSLPLTNEHAPNVYLSVTLIGRSADGVPDFRQGYVNLPVAPRAQELQVRLVGQPERAGPGDSLTISLQVTDANGNPVQGEFSLAVVDLAALALAEPNSKDILSAFYGEQPLGVNTSLSLAAYARRMLDLPGGLGGGGDGSIPSVTRENFPDTAYWDAAVVTGADGTAQVTLQLPDTLTTWQVEARGLTNDTRVGQGSTQVITSKDLLVRPVTPRFLVVNDHAQVAAVVQNNTASPLQVDVTLQGSGFSLDADSPQSQQVSVPAQGRARVEWWGTAQDVEAVDLTFAAASGSLQDAAKPSLGKLPVLRYIAPQTFRTSGTLDEAGAQTELVSLPRSYQVQGGALNIELSPSLAAAMLRGLDVLESAPYESTEQIISSFLPNLETYRTLQKFNTADPALKTRLDRNLNQALQRLAARQKTDGGWAWWHEAESDPYVTTYALLGLTRARTAGITISPDMIQRAVDFLKQAGPRPPQAQGAAAIHGLQAPTQGGDTWPPEPWGWERVVFREYVLSQNGGADPDLVQQAFQNRAKLSPWAQALLAQTLDSLSAGSPDARAILDELQSAAVRSATGAAWELQQDESGLLAAGYNMQDGLSNTAIVLWVLAQRDPASPLVTDALRYLMAHRGPDGGWPSTYTSAWSLIALNEVAQSTGELSSEYAYSASLNNNILAEGRATGTQQAAPVVAQAPVQTLYPDYPNVLVLSREGGAGRLYYTVGLNVSRPAEDVAPLSQGLSIERAVLPFGQDCAEKQCLPLAGAQVNQKVTVRLSLAVPDDLHYVAVQDYIPAGAEILDTRLRTSQLGIGGEAQTEQTYDPRQPFEKGWGWERFGDPQVYDDRITWTAPYLPAGTYELTYTLVLLQPGQFRVLPASAWQLYFPEVYGNSAGAVFEIQP